MKKLTWLKSSARVALGIGVGLLVTEMAFRYRDGGAFAHVNFYLPDATLGARLKPGATEKLRFGSPANPITSIRINGEGYRGAAWPAAAADEIVVVGDSQTFGLGVEESETFSAVLGHALGDKTVRNLGVPTYGPAEYNAVLAEQLAKRPAKTVIWIANMANDLFEASHPNTARHVIWDGWAVRKESAPAHVAEFPGRALLYTDSHAFLAARRWLHAQGPQDSDAGFASEGSWKDIGAAATTAKKEHVVAEDEAKLDAKRHEEAVAKAKSEATSQDYVILSLAQSEAKDADYKAFIPPAKPEDEDYILGEQYLALAHMNPGDIVSTGYVEGGRDVRINSQQIQRGVALRNALEKRVKENAARRGDKKTLDEFAKRDELVASAAKVAAEPTSKPIVLSPLAPALKEAKAICDRAGARLVVVALPIDVQVSKDEWKKYKAEAVDMTASKILNDDVVVAASAIGAEGFDALPALTAAEPGAFLDGDLHMTPKGHRALGEALAKALKAPKLARPDDSLPLPVSRSRPPLASEWIPESEIGVVESDPAGCETKKVREWVGIFCRSAKTGKIAQGVKVDRGVEVMAGALPGEALLVAPVIAGQDLHAVFAFDGTSREFTVKGTKIVGFSKPAPARTDIPGPPDTAAAYCACAKDCAKAPAPADADCVRTYASDCAKMLACASGDPAAPPTCAEGAARAGAAGRCRPLCSHEVTCGSGTGSCTSWQGGDVCM